MRHLPKDIPLRYRVIDRLLRDYDHVKTQTVVDKLFDRYDLSVGTTTIQRDIRNMQADLHAPIEYDNSLRAYFYPDNVEDIFPVIDLVEEEVNALLFYSKTITQYKEYPIFEEISMAIKKIIDASNMNLETKELLEEQTLIETEKHPLIPGIGCITGLLQTIAKRQVIELEYGRFGEPTKKHLIKPLLLKEDKLMWYIIGVNIKYNEINTFGLDRIKSYKVKNETFDPVEFDSKEYFQYSFGVTVANKKPLDVVIQFNPEQGNYLKTLPIHSTQKILEDNEERFVISLKVIPSYEFYSKILSYGCNAKVISPAKLIEGFLNNFRDSLKNYEFEK